MANVRVFGSVARGDDRADSDVDFLVDLEIGRTFFDLGGFLTEVEQLLGRKVDVVTDQALPSFGKELPTAGAIFDLEGRVIGGSITFEAADIDEARALSKKDPYAHSDIAVSMQIIPFRARWKDGIFYDGPGYSSKQGSHSSTAERNPG